ncbi:hypothetical protein KKF34_18330 [Myxococcota bacterium]|nr:hypothetical protein [Myxococcota bacterium]MBU1383003.1 hypothetical protein [Myxococcota bacterium]MBU1498842.1 hypothetical protein [Myxococcota bacterium]
MAKVLIGIVIVAALGAGGYFIFVKKNPEKAEKMKEDIANKAAEAGKKAKDFGKKVGEDAKELGKDIGDKSKELGGKAKDFGVKVGEDAKELGKDIGDKSKELGKDIGDKSKELGKDIGDKAVDLKDKTGELLEKGKDKTVEGFDAAKTKAIEIAKSRKCPKAYRQLKKCYPDHMKAFGKAKALSKCSFAASSGNEKFLKGLDCLDEAADCEAIKKCVPTAQMDLLKNYMK